MTVAMKDEQAISKPEIPEPKKINNSLETSQSSSETNSLEINTNSPNNKRNCKSTLSDEDSTEEDVDDKKPISHSIFTEDSNLDNSNNTHNADNPDIPDGSNPDGNPDIPNGNPDGHPDSNSDNPHNSHNSHNSHDSHNSHNPESESSLAKNETGDDNDDKSSPGNSNLGRRGDPRMHKAVAARLASPEMSLLDALIAGGFEFPDGTEGAGKSDRNVYDSENVLLCQRKNQLSRRLRLARKGATSRFSDPSISVQNLDNRPTGNDRNIYNGNVPSLLSAPFWQASTLPLMGGSGIGNPRLGHGHVSTRAQGIMQMVLSQSNRQASHAENDLLEARAALLANNGAMHLKYKNNGISSPERKKLRQEQELQNLYMPTAEQLAVPNFYQHGLHHGQLPSSTGLIAGQMQNLQFRNQFHPSLLQNNVTAADLALHAANKEQNGLDRYYLDLAAASMGMGMGKEKIQSMLSNTNGAPPTEIPANNKYTHEAVDTPSPTALQLATNGGKSEFGSRAQESQIDVAIKFYKTERALLVQRCLLMAGFDQSEVCDDGVLCDLFEERLGK